MVGVEGITGNVGINNNSKILFCTLGLSILLFTKIGHTRERTDFEDLEYGFV